MAGIRYIDLISDAESITQVTSIRSSVRRLANDICAGIAAVAEWPFLWTTDWFQTVAPYETGNVNLTNGDATVSGGATSPTFTAAMVGRNIRFGSETGYYTIKSRTSATELELDQPYTGDTDTNVSFSIYKDEYLLRADLDAQKRLRQSENGLALFSLSATEFDEQFPSPSGEGVPSLDVYTGRAVKTYSTGTIAITSGTRSITGSGTSWTTVEGLTRGTKIQVGTLIFTVKSVDSDTSLTIYESPSSTVSAGTSYVAILDNPVVLVHAIPDSVMTIYYRFQRIPAVMDADNDIPDLPYPMHPLIRLGMLPDLWRHKGMIDRAIEAQNAFDKELGRWMAKYELNVLDRSYPIHPFLMRRGLLEARWPVGTGIPLTR